MPNELPISCLSQESNGITLTWIRDDNVELYQPVSQVYGIVYNDKGEILLIKENGKWKIPGGTPENGETAEQTLHRELMEEADVVIKDLFPLGVQRVDYPSNPKTGEGDLYYQYRYICFLDHLENQSPDPDTGITYPRQFVPASEVTKYVRWGEIGNAMFADAHGVFLNHYCRY